MENGQKVYERNCWELERERFTGLVTGLLQRRPTAIKLELYESGNPKTANLSKH
jgi:hypothetical protein